MSTEIGNYYLRNTLPTSATVPATVQLPTSTAELADLIKSAAAQSQPVHAFSAGKNWGYGSSQAAADGHMILDLSNMNQILEVNEELAFAIIEPGVTQAQLFQHLQEHHPNLWLDGNGAGPEASIVGNTLERGFGHTPIGDRSKENHILEVVDGRGEVLSSPLNHEVATRSIYPTTFGPDLFSLIIQSNMGIVTKMSVSLMRKPAKFKAFYIGCAEEQIEALVEAVREARLSWLFHSCTHIGNTARTLSNEVPYPWDMQKEKRQALPADFWKAAANQAGLLDWNGSGGLYGEPEVVQAIDKKLQEFLGEYNYQSMESDEASQLGLEDAVGLLRGRPTDAYLKTSFWRSKTSRETAADPIVNNAGITWLVPRLPARQRDLQRVFSILKSVYAEFEFDLPITLTFVNAKSLIATTNISFDKTSPADMEAAQLCFKKGLLELSKAGYPPYRLPHGQIHDLPLEETYWQRLRDIKAVFDPAGILSRGRYELL